MTASTLIEIMGIISAAVMPLWNIPLIIRILKRKSANDLSLVWVSGVWLCVIAMLPSAIVSEDRILKLFGISNSVLFSCVFAVVLKFHNKPE